MDKKVLRRQIAARKRAMTREQIESASQRLAARLVQTDAYQNALSIYGYLSFNQEIRTMPILQRAIADGKRVAVPKVFGDEMRFIWLDDLSQVAPGYYDIPEPIADGPVADDALALVLMPGLAFDPEGHRIGYGGGFTIAISPAIPSTGLSRSAMASSSSIVWTVKRTTFPSTWSSRTTKPAHDAKFPEGLLGPTGNLFFC